ncbi:Protein of unknown function [Gryllus bimaculatus]|nr:Protein of unknown function [Gryllus bimaculatus]
MEFVHWDMVNKYAVGVGSKRRRVKKDDGVREAGLRLNLPPKIITMNDDQVSLKSAVASDVTDESDSSNNNDEEKIDTGYRHI